MRISKWKWRVPVSEERFQMFLPRDLKARARARASQLGQSVGHYIRGLIESDLDSAASKSPRMSFPFGEQPISTGRTTGSEIHDRSGHL